jgi:Lon-like ATP-dependent protease
LVDEGSRLAGRRDRVSLRFSEIANQLREASYWARRRGSERIAREDVEEATRRRERREGSISDRIQELLEDGTLLVSTSGVAVGQVNGLSVYDLGYHAFGKPTRITASAAPGRAGIINIEREARLSGGIYDKGVLIISGYLRRGFADLGPLSLTASLAFEQSYAGVDGDSASIAEVVALMSELSGLPVDQGIAITGSINQHGEVQPVGGVNEKIAGFHALCAARGLDGHQGVVLPRRNMRDLMLHPGVVEDVGAGRFTVFGVDNVEDALEIALDAPIATIDQAVRDRLADYTRAMAEAPGGDLAPTSGVSQPPSMPLPGA